MSEPGRYSKVSRRMWGDEKFRRLTPLAPSGAALFIRLLTGPELTNVPGLFPAWDAGMARAMGWTLEAYREAYLEAYREGLVIADWEVGLVWVPNAIRYNEPESPKVILSWERTMADLPDCDLKTRAFSSLLRWATERGESWGKAMAKAIGKPIGKAMAYQEQEQEQEQEQILSCQGKDLTGNAPCAASAPRQDNTTELESEPDQTEATPARLLATETLLQAAPAQREPQEQKPASERQPVALPTRAARVRSELSELPIGELAKRWRENPTWVAESSPQTRPEMLAAAKAWDTAVGLRPTPLGHPGRDPCTKALLELYADGVPQATILRACEQAGRTGWLCGTEPDFRRQTRKRRISALTMGVLRELLDAAPSTEVIGVSPAVAALIAERKKATG